MKRNVFAFFAAPCTHLCLSLIWLNIAIISLSFDFLWSLFSIIISHVLPQTAVHTSAHSSIHSFICYQKQNIAEGIVRLLSHLTESLEQFFAMPAEDLVTSVIVIVSLKSRKKIRIQIMRLNFRMVLIKRKALNKRKPGLKSLNTWLRLLDFSTATSPFFISAEARFAIFENLCDRFFPSRPIINLLFRFSCAVLGEEKKWKIHETED